jgi:ectoine hydroxylase-related dioxygenase (phytanoyl-CoA dioxygenase family)
VERAAPVRLDEPALRRYRDDGYVRLGRIVAEDERAALLAEEARFRPRLGYGTRENRTLLVSMQLCHRSEPVRRMCTAGAHVPLVVQLLGPDVCLTHTQFLTKLPDLDGSRSDIPWHQDNGYGRLEPMTDVTVWLALTDADESNGGLYVVPGSHRRELLAHGPAGVNPWLRESPAPGDAVAVPLRAGEAVAFSGLTVHGSGPNRSRGPRTGFYARYCEPGARMLSEDGRPVLDDPHSWMVAGEARGPAPGSQG